MKKRILCLALALITVFSLSFTAIAATPESVSPRYNSTFSVAPSFWFSGSNAYCKLIVIAENANASIRATVYLKDASGNTITAWSLTGTGYLSWQDYHPVSKGTYTMTFYVQVYHNTTGSDYISDSITATKS